MDPYQPTKEDRFTFGLWTFGNPGRDPFGEPVRERISPVEGVKRLSQLGAYGVNLHDNDLIPIDATPAERERIVSEFKKALADHDMKVPMATTNLFGDPIFKDGAFTSNEPQVRAYAVQKTMRAMDLGVELGAKVYVFWGGREGAEVDASKDAVQAVKWMRECLNFLIGYAKDNRYDLKFALEAKPNEPRGDIYFPTTGHMLALIETLADPSMCGVNPEVAHETMAGLNFYHGVAQALEAGKLFHIDLNGQKPGRYDQDFRFGQEDIKGVFFLVKLLEDYNWGGMRHFDAHALRTEDVEGVWDFCAGCMRTFKILQEKVRRFNADAEIQGLLREIRAGHPELEGWMRKYTKEHATGISALNVDRRRLGGQGRRYEKLDQLTTEVLLGVR
jgi:xylose isomerase